MMVVSMDDGHPEERTLTELVSRHLTLAAHGVFGVEVGLAMILTGSPVAMDAWAGAAARNVLGFTSLVGGCAIILGIVLTETRRRGWLAMYVGCLLLALWHLAMAVSYSIIAATSQVDAAPPWREISSDSEGRPYIPFVYLTLFILVSVQAYTLRRVGRPLS